MGTTSATAFGRPLSQNPDQATRFRFAQAATGFRSPLYPHVILSTIARPIYFPGHTRHLG